MRIVKLFIYLQFNGKKYTSFRLGTGLSFPKFSAKVIHFNRIITHYEEFKPLFRVFCAVFLFCSGE